MSLLKFIVILMQYGFTVLAQRPFKRGDMQHTSLDKT